MPGNFICCLISAKRSAFSPTYSLAPTKSSFLSSSTEETLLAVRGAAAELVENELIKFMMSSSYAFPYEWFAGFSSRPCAMLSSNPRISFPWGGWWSTYTASPKLSAFRSFLHSSNYATSALSLLTFSRKSLINSVMELSSL